MNIVYSADDNYARHAGISIMSLLDNNKSSDIINIYIIDNGISEENRKNIDKIVSSYHRKIEYINFEKYKSKLVLNNYGWELPISAYARLFVDEMLPQTVNKVIYLDCDIIVNDSIETLWNTDLCGKTIGAVQDICYNVFKDETGIKEDYRYFCSGVILIDLNLWRAANCNKKIISYIDSRNGVVRHHDQTILNGVFGTDYFVLHPKYDVLTPMFIMSYDNMKAYFKCGNDFYSKSEVDEAVKEPAIIHFTSSNIGRPWENNAHPKSGIYKKYWKRSPWRNVPYIKFKPSYGYIQRRTYWLYRHIPIKIIRLLSKH